MASGATDGSLTLWEPATGIGRPLRGHRGEVRGRGGRVVGAHDGMVRGLVFSADGTQLVSAGGDGTIRRWRVASEPPATAEALTSAVVTPEGEIRTP